ncbi:MAG TPA: hypothetical protein VHZ54_00045 [Solirubrobacterales bacterium]|nr:hypothetical protein [Solirubrobacterales bacterium]
MEERARFADIAGKAGHYESFYLKACRPDGGQGIWIRHTVHKRPGAEPTGSIWFTLFDRAAGAPRAAKLTVPASELSVPAGGWIRVADAEVGPGRAEGSLAVAAAAGDTGGASAPALAASWSLRFDGSREPCHYLPADWLYEAPLPRTKFVAPFPDAVFDGVVEVDGRSIDVSGWPGMIGHNWGTEHAERWVWLEGTGFDEGPGTWFDAGAARVKLGPKVSPWVPSGFLSLDGTRHRLGGLGALRSARIEETPTGCSFLLPGNDIVVHGRLEAPREAFVGWVYANPRGDEHHTVNCSVADLELTVEQPGRPARHLTLTGGGAYELGMRETDHGIPIQPFTDG